MKTELIVENGYLNKAKPTAWMFRTFFSVLIAFFIFFVTPTSAHAATYYVDFTNGLDTNNGTSTDTPWKNLSKINSYAFNPGDFIYLKKGETWNGYFNVSRSGSAGNLITYGAYGTGADPIVNASGTNYAAIVDGKSYIRIQNIKFQNATLGQLLLYNNNVSDIEIDSITTSGGARGFYILNNTGPITIANTTISNATTAGIDIGGGTHTTFTLSNIQISGSANGISLDGPMSSISISGSSLSNTTGRGLHITANGVIGNLVVTSSHFDSNTTGGFYNQGTITAATISNSYFNSNTGYGISLGQSTGKTVTDLTISNTQINTNGTQGIIFGGVGQFTNIDLTGLTVQDNSSYALYVTGNVNGFDLTDSTINSNNSEGVYFYTDTGETVSNVTIDNTTSSDNGQSGFAFHGPGSGTGATLTNVTANDNGHDGINVKTGWRNINISGCTVNSNGTDGSGGDGDGISFHDSTTGSIRYCSINNNVKSAVAHVGDSDLTMAYNLFTHTTNGTIALVYVEGTGTYYFYNNVIYSAAQTGNGLQVNSGTTATIKNNIVYGFDKGIYNVSGTVTEDYNQVYNALTGWSGLTQGTHSISTNPLFVNIGTLDFHLTSSSPGINMGTNVGEVLDYPANTVPQGASQDMGAYEFLLPATGTSLAQYKSNGTTAITTGDWTNETTVVLKFNMSSSNSSDSLTPQIELRAVGTDFTNAVTHSGDAVAYSGTPVTGSVTITGLTSGATYHWQARTNNAAGSGSLASYGGNAESATDFKIDSIAPTEGSISINAGATNTSSRTVTLTISATDSDSGINQMIISEDSSFSGASWETYATTKSFSLSSGDGTKTVYIKFTDNNGNESASTSDSIVLDTVAPTSIELNDPGDTSYSNDNRPTFKWKATSDSTAGLSKYVLDIDNPSAGSGDPNGDFTIDDIPVSRTSDYETNKYIIHYENFSDSDDNNNYISVRTKSSSEWGSDANDGKLREGKVTWKVKAVDNIGNETSSSRTLFQDRTNPEVELIQLNDQKVSTNTFTTTDRTPTIFGKIKDILAGSDTVNSQDENGPKVASGPKLVEISIERKEGSVYKTQTIYTINMDKPWYTCNDQEVSNNSKQRCDKYLPFEYSPSSSLELGTYRINLTGKDKADNTSERVTFTLNIVPLSEFVTGDQEKIINDELKDLSNEEQTKIKEELDLTKPEESAPVDNETKPKLAERVIGGFKNLWAYVREVVEYGGQSISQGLKQPKQLIANVGEWLSYSAISFGEIVLDKNPTQISEVKIEQLTANSVVITWKTNHLATSKVNYGESLDYGKDVQSSKKVHYHKVEVTNRNPATKYYYEVMSQNKNYVYDAHHEFVTLDK